MRESGYDIFDKSISFYNDICTKYTTENGTDIILSDRINDIYGPVSNISLCQTGCDYEYYNSSIKKAKCNCNIQEKQSFISDIKEIRKNFFNKENIVDIFSKGIMNSNFLVLKCYKLALCFKYHIYNYGCIIMIVLFLLFIIFMLIYYIRDSKIINDFIQTIINKSFFSYEIKNFNINRKQTLKRK